MKVPSYGFAIDPSGKLPWFVRLEAPFLLFTISADDAEGRGFDVIFPLAFIPEAPDDLVGRAQASTLRHFGLLDRFSRRVCAAPVPVPVYLNLSSHLIAYGVLDLSRPDAPVYAAADSSHLDDPAPFSEAAQLTDGNWVGVDLTSVTRLSSMDAHLKAGGVCGRSTRSIQIETEDHIDFYDQIRAHSNGFRDAA
jgi:hypothetical protein